MNNNRYYYDGELLFFAPNGDTMGFASKGIEPTPELKQLWKDERGEKVENVDFKLQKQYKTMEDVWVDESNAPAGGYTANDIRITAIPCKKDEAEGGKEVKKQTKREWVLDTARSYMAFAHEDLAILLAEFEYRIIQLEKDKA